MDGEKQLYENLNGFRAGDGGRGGDGVNGGNGGDGGSIFIQPNKETDKSDLFVKLFGENYKKHGLVGVVALGIFYFAINFFGNVGKFNFNAGATNVVNGDNSYITQINGNNTVITGSKYNDEQEKIWNDAYVPIQDFINKLNNRDFISARSFLDKQIVKDPKFSEEELRQFMDNVDGQVTIRDPLRDDAKKKDDEFVSNRGFYLFLRYLKDGQQVNEKWRFTLTKYNKENNKWQIGEMRCEDKRCENGSLLAEKNY